jgi:hypothetical protein
MTLKELGPMPLTSEEKRQAWLTQAEALVETLAVSSPERLQLESAIRVCQQALNQHWYANHPIKRRGR